MLSRQGEHVQNTISQNAAFLSGIAVFFLSTQTNLDCYSSPATYRVLQAALELSWTRLFLCHFLTASASFPRCRSPPSEV